MNLYELSADLVALRDLEEVEASEIIAIAVSYTHLEIKL